MPTLLFSAFLRFSSDLLISPIVFGVLVLTFFLGLQYSFDPPAPQAFPDFVSVHVSYCHLFKFVPLSDLRTLPLPLLHLAIA